MSSRALPKVTLINTSGTIADVALSNLEITAYGHASTPGRAVLDGRQILDRIPEISQVVDIVQVIEASSLQYKTVEYLKLARLIKTIDTPVVVTRGTSDIPELAFFLDVTLNRQLPVVVTGSMRPMSALSSDAKYNLLQACSLAGSDAARARGVLVALGDRITSGYYAVKLSANRMDTFKAIEAGQLGFFVNWHPQFFFEPARPSNKPFFGGTVLDNENMVTLPKVASVCSRVNQEKDELQEAIRRGIHGLVFANWAAGQISFAEWEQELCNLAQGGTPVVRSTQSSDGFIAPTMIVKEGNQIASGHLGPNKAVILLQLAIAAYGTDIERIRAAFGTDWTLSRIS